MINPVGNLSGFFGIELQEVNTKNKKTKINLFILLK